MGWVARAKWCASTLTAGVGAFPVPACADGGVRSETACPAAPLGGSEAREGPSVEAAQRHREQWGLGSGEGSFWLACVAATS